MSVWNMLSGPTGGISKADDYTAGGHGHMKVSAV